MRRILIVPSVSSSSVINSDSFNELYLLTETIVKLKEKAYWYVVMPPWVRDGLRAHERIHYVYGNTTRDAAINDIIGYSSYEVATWFARRGGMHVIDAVITDCVQFSLQLGQFLSDPARSRVPIIVRDLGQSHLQKWKDKESAVSFAMSLATSKFGFISEQHKDEVVSFLRQYVRPSLVGYFLEGAFRWPVSSNLEYLDGCKKTATKREKITAFYGGDPTWNKGRKVLSIYRKLFAFGIETVVASTASSSKVKRTFPDRDVSYMSEVNVGVSGDSYYLEAARAHLFVSATDNEVAFYDEIERLILGQVGVFPYLSFTEEVLGRDYPFFYNLGNEDEACELAVWISENYDKAVRKIKKHIRRVRKEISKEVIFGSIWNHICKCIDDSYRINVLKKEVKGKRQPLMNSVQKVAESLGDEFMMTVFLDVLEETVGWLKPWNRKGTLKTLGLVRQPLPTMYDLREMLDNLGWVDQCDDSEIRLCRERKPLEGVKK